MRQWESKHKKPTPTYDNIPGMAFLKRMNMSWKK